MRLLKVGCVAMLLVAGCATTDTRGDTRIVFAGDSLTYGLYASSEDRGYRELVVAELSRTVAVQQSRGGQTGNTAGAVADSITAAPDTTDIVLAVGTNDVWKTPPETFASDYDDLMQVTHGRAPDARLVCLGVWQNADGARAYDAVVRSQCDDAEGVFVPITDLFDDPANRGPAGRVVFGGVSDDFHPNDAGYRSIADRILAVL